MDPSRNLGVAKELLAENEARAAIHALSTAQPAAQDQPSLLHEIQVHMVEALARDGRCRQARALNARIGGEVTPALTACDQGRRQKPAP